MVLWNLLDGGLSRSKPLLRPSEYMGVVPRVPILITLVHNQCLFHKAQHNAVLNRHRRVLPPRSPDYLLIHSHPFHLVIRHLPTLSFLAQSQIKVLINFITNHSNQ
jgi:hypothetical protein